VTPSGLGWTHPRQVPATQAFEPDLFHWVAITSQGNSPTNQKLRFVWGNWGKFTAERKCKDKLELGFSAEVAGMRTCDKTFGILGRDDKHLC